MSEYDSREVPGYPSAPGLQHHLGRFGLNLLDAIISIKHLLIIFSTSGGVGEMRGKQNPVLFYYHMASSPQKAVTPLVLELLDPREFKRRGEPAERLLTFPLGEDPTKMVQISALLPAEARDQLLTFLRANSDVFAWPTSDMPNIPLEVITHKLNIDPRCRLVRQKKRSFASEQQKAIDEEVNKLIAAGHIWRHTTQIG